MRNPKDSDPNQSKKTQTITAEGPACSLAKGTAGKELNANGHTTQHSNRKNKPDLMEYGPKRQRKADTQKRRTMRLPSLSSGSMIGTRAKKRMSQPMH